ncbi:MAG: flagellar basal-body rod protein FlgF, partial [Phycisphaerae bacterium]|nr:flagellar basal-body rod protein FlgF [Phycisphaerae bacterium]
MPTVYVTLPEPIQADGVCHALAQRLVSGVSKGGSAVRTKGEGRFGMVYGIYQSAAGLQMNQFRQEVLANNLANLDTTGFKQDLAVIRERPLAMREAGNQPRNSDPSLAGMTGGTFISPTYTSFAQGPMQPTGGRLDVALSGDGFFVVRDGNQVRYTRDGKFTIDDQGELATTTGKKVLGPDGTVIPIPSNLVDKVTISASGEVKAGARSLGQIEVVEFADNHQLRKVGANLFEAIGVEPTWSNTTVQQGYVEGSSVEPTQAMVSMIEVSRAYELNGTLL